MMRTRKVWGVLGLLLALVVVVGYGQYGQPPGIQPPGTQPPSPALMQQLQQQFMQQIQQLMYAAAKEFNIRLAPGVFWASRSTDNVILASAAVEGLEKLTPEDLQKGVVLGLMWWPGKQTPIYLPDGFYKVRVIATSAPGGALSAQAQLLDKSDKVVAVLPAKVKFEEAKGELGGGIELNNILCPFIEFKGPGNSIIRIYMC